MRSTSTPGQEPEATLRRCPVCVWDTDPIRRRLILDTLSTAQYVFSTTAVSLHDFTLDSGTGGIVFSCSSGSITPSDLRLIATLSHKFAFVVCVVGGLGESKLAIVCQLLLAGATHVMEAGASDFLFQLRIFVERAAQRLLAAEYEGEMLRSIMSAAGFAGRSIATFSLFRSLRGVSSMTELPVLITGETGTGKELIATAIHALDSRRSHRPFVSLNCAALPEQLSESELFGHQRGAFTGAERERAGLFRSAEGGVLFLDEVGELNLSLQSKLLRVLQSSRLRSVGADREVAINVRVVAATNRHLEQMVRDGAFREDLFYRLNVLSLHVPPLRERSIDIGPLVDHFIEKYSPLWEQKGRPIIGRDFIHGLENSMLPGNARQLENIVRRALVEWEGDRPLSLKDLPTEIWQELSGAVTLAAPPQEPIPMPQAASNASLEVQAVEYLQRHEWNLSNAIRHLESALVRGALSVAKGKQSEAARLLGISTRSVYNKLHKNCPS